MAQRKSEIDESLKGGLGKEGDNSVGDIMYMYVYETRSMSKRSWGLLQHCFVGYRDQACVYKAFRASSTLTSIRLCQAFCEVYGCLAKAIDCDL